MSGLSTGIAIGIDAGGTKTLGILVDRECRELARAQAGGANPWDVGPDAARVTLQSVLAPLIAGGGVRSVCLGSAGVDRDDDRVAAEAMLRPMLSDSVVVDVRNDAAAALGIAGPKRPAMVVVAGTGSIAYGEKSDGSPVRIGGHGAILGDCGSGTALGIGALRHTADVFDGIDAKSALSDAVTAQLKLRRAGDIAGRIMHPDLDIGLIASLAPVVDAALRGGDPAAKRLVAAEGAALALNAKRLARAIRSDSTMPALLVGSIFATFADIREAIKAALRETGPVVVLESSESVMGPARIALGLIPG